MTALQNGRQFPNLTLPAVGGGMLALPADLAGSYGIVLVYRGSWCPHCNAQLAAFGRAQGALDEVNAKIVALSADDEETSTALVKKRRLGFPVGHSVDVDAVAAALGCYPPDPRNLESTGFVLAPDGTVLVAVYSSGAMGRLVPDDVLRSLAHLQIRH